MKRLNMTNKIMISMVLGMVVGLIVGPAIAPVKVVGDIFLRLIQMSVVVLIMGAVIEAVGSLDPKELGKLGGKIFAWFMGLTALAAALGIGLGYIVKPGAGLNMDMGATAIAASEQTLSEMIVGFFPTNIIDAMAKANMIQVIIFSILFGLSLSVIGKQDKDNVVLNFIRHFNVAILNVVKMVMNLAPIGIFSLLAWVTGTIGVKVIIPLAKFLGSMAIGTVIYMIFLIFISAAYAKVSPVRLAKHLWKMTVVAFTTTSSAITLPTKMEDSEIKLGVSKRISRLVNPLGMALNSNGLSLYLSLACITLAQFFGMEMSIIELVRIVVLSTLACLGTVVVPGGGLVALATVLPAMGLPPESIALLAGIDWFSGMFRTVLNVDSDALVAMMIAVDEKELDYDIFNGKKVISSSNS
ncbi:Na+/H+-dicarboxylate symporter [Tissierella praeacuta DSM 18095]|uniref:Na+/H+-dicarboxylate symporter n=1 Tax=Tissierella praeacuta DSM 18095 TaxID=1123404 RepID=A0A1M4WM40_9FIRM|nr:dicarboxylate/amino acid:cation symporter [Tissierella praeacuta]TCU79130.1 Na+/H+-dicarboxylate symporter [Tissierella praeacuta]SHE82230.1 Na+/H+-dicarboxylate symporter [Tissierella praeacuta DSM 18095]SUO99309.1 Glutamate-aspartate carrier protein [Tissierella praeacuta]